MKFNKLFLPYNPWWRQDQQQFLVPEFRRPIFHTLYDDLVNLRQMISITGPRRIGKSTLLLQMINQLRVDGVDPKKIVYYSFDDPALVANVDVDELVDETMKLIAASRGDGPTYLFLDEIQRLDKWELYLKKYYDLQYPIRVVVSGSASSPIFKKTRESLLGRVKDYHLLPFSFREFALYRLRDNGGLTEEIQQVYRMGKTVEGILTENPNIDREEKAWVPNTSEELRATLAQLLNTYFLEGGFPEVWETQTWVKKQEYLYDNQVNKVIYEDLILAADFRKPELLKRFYVSLLERPGREIAISGVAKETEINKAQIEKYLPLLEMTDLVYRISKFRSGTLRVRRGNMKFYLVDLALRNAVLRLTDTLLKDEAMLGLYAENLVFLALKKWKGTVQMDYYREKESEVDFIVHIAPNRFLPVEVKYRNRLLSSQCAGVRSFRRKFRSKSLAPIIVTKNWSDFGLREDLAEASFCIPLPLFLLLFD